MKPPASYEVYIDGASRGNPGPSGVGVVILDGAEKPIHQFSKYLGQTTNNVAEYLALIYALQEALREGYTALRIHTDSELLAHQINGRYKVRDERLRLFHDVALHLMRLFRSCHIGHVPRTQNRLADRLASQAAGGSETESGSGAVPSVSAADRRSD